MMHSQEAQSSPEWLDHDANFNYRARRINGLRTCKLAFFWRLPAGLTERKPKMTPFPNALKLAACLSALLLAGCGGGGSNSASPSSALRTALSAGSATSGAAVASVRPVRDSTDVATSTNGSSNIVTGTAVSISFSVPMDAASVTSAAQGSMPTFTLKETDGANVAGTVVMNTANTVATFIPVAAALATQTRYTATLSTAARSAAGTPLDNPESWSFTTGSAAATSQAPVELGAAATFTLLSKTGITNVYQSTIVGDVGTSPISGTAMLLRCAEVTGNIHVVDAAGPQPCALDSATLLTAAVGDMGGAYDDAAGRISPAAVELGAGQIGGLTLAPGIYKWGTDVLVSTDVTLSGSANDVWIFQVAGEFKQAGSTRITLAGGALAKNIFWQVADNVSIGTNAHFEGVVLGKKLIAVKTGASAAGRLLSQTAITLEMNGITEPAL
jgi:hypothetical protein